MTHQYIYAEELPYFLSKNQTSKMLEKLTKKAIFKSIVKKAEQYNCTITFSAQVIESDTRYYFEFVNFAFILANYSNKELIKDLFKLNYEQMEYCNGLARQGLICEWNNEQNKFDVVPFNFTIAEKDIIQFKAF